MTRCLIASSFGTLVAMALVVLLRCRRCPDLAAHYWDDEVDRYCLGDCRTEDLQAFASLWERAR